ncbi:TMTC2 protein, partial [Polyodon spathula]|nr:TMTC2 protein [Polyodon spathula]
MDVDVCAGGDSTRKKMDTVGDGAVEVVPLELYDSSRAKIDANLRWLFAKAYGIGKLYSRAIKTNQDLLPETPWMHIFYNDFWGTLLTHSGSHKSYRPLCTLSFRLNHALGGLEPWGYHLVNILLHCSVTGLFTRLSRLLLGGGHWTLMAGLLFASHPVHTEAVAGIVGRADVGAALFFLLSLLCYMRYCSLRGHSAHCLPWLLGSFACAACSMLWKEQGVTVLAISAVYDVFVFHGLKFHQVISLIFKVSRFAFPVCSWMA